MTEIQIQANVVRTMFRLLLLVGSAFAVSACTAPNPNAQGLVTYRGHMNFPSDFPKSSVFALRTLCTGPVNFSKTSELTDSGERLRDVAAREDKMFVSTKSFPLGLMGDEETTFVFVDSLIRPLAIGRVTVTLPDAYGATFDFEMVAIPPICQNLKQDDKESDEDCGGTECAPCDVGKMCRRNADCLSANCKDGVCREKEAPPDLLVQDLVDAGTDSGTIDAAPDIGSDAAVDSGTDGPVLDAGSDGPLPDAAMDGPEIVIDMTVIRPDVDMAMQPVVDMAKVEVDMTMPDLRKPDVDMAVLQPVVTQVVPESGPNTGGTQVTVSGTDFEDGATVTVGGKPSMDVVFVSKTSLKVTIPANPGAFGKVAVEVKNPSGGSGSANVFSYVAQIALAAPVLVNVGPKPTHVLALDLNKDGKKDLVTSNSADDTVTVLLGRGGAAFEPSISVTVGLNPRQTAAGDFNGDGVLDLLTANSKSDTASVLLGNGNGTFKPAVSYPVGTLPYSCGVGDLDADGTIDLVVGNFISNNITIYAGQGDGTFVNRRNIPAAENLKRLVVIDLNGDGKLDLVSTSEAKNNFLVQLGVGNGTFLPGQAFAADFGPDSIDFADANSDGKLDAIVANDGKGTLSYLLGNGDGTFQPATPIMAGNKPQTATWGDMDGDGKPDIVVASNLDASLSILRNVDGAFPGQPITTRTGGLLSFHVALSDLNGDGKLDAVVTNYNSSNVSVFLNTSL